MCVCVQEQERVDRVSRRVCVLEEVECCTRELTTLLDSGDTTLHSEHMKVCVCVCTLPVWEKLMSLVFVCENF